MHFVFKECKPSDPNIKGIEYDLTEARNTSKLEASKPLLLLRR
jgi:hypothetical protein